LTTIYFDFETGGTEPHHPSIQLAAIAVDDETGNELASFDERIAFDESKCDDEALLINSWDMDQWKNAPSPAVVAKRFAQFIEPHKCVKMVSKRTGKPYFVAKGAAYNAPFDWPRLRELFGDSFLPVSYLVRDVLQRVIFHFDENGNPPESFKLSEVCKHVGLDVNGAHDALADVRMTAALHHRIQAL
jgi:DNA polymerase III epsilon subunit-like protein